MTLKHQIPVLPVRFVLVVITISVLTLIGWQFDIEILRHPFFYFSAMNPLAAVSFLAAALAFLIFMGYKKSAKAAYVGYILLIIPFAAGLLSSLAHTFQSPFSIDLVLYANKFQVHDINNISYKMSSPTALNFIFLSLCVASLNFSSSIVKTLSNITAMLIGFLSLFFLLGYIYNVKEFYEFMQNNVMSVQSAACFICFGVAILISQPDEPLVSTVTSAHAGGMIARSLIPFIIVIPILLGLSRIYLSYEYGITPELGALMLISITILILFFLVWKFSALLNRQDILRKEAEQKISALNLELERKIGERTFELSRYKDALDKSSIVATADQDGIINYVNDNYCKISKFDCEEAIVQPNYLINQDFHSEEFIRDIWENLTNGNIWKGELKNKTKDGTFYWVDTTIVPFVNKSGKAYQYMAIQADITDRKRGEEELAKSEKRFRGTLDVMLEGVQIIGFDWRYIYVNGSLEKQANRSKEEFIGNTVQELYPGVERSLLFNLCEQCMNERVSIQTESPFTFPDGSVGWFDLSLLPVPEGIFILSVDITDRKKLQDQQRLLAWIINSSDDAIISMNLDDIITSWNNSAERIYGYSEEEAIGKHTSMIIPYALQKEQATLSKKIKSGESVEQFQTERIKKDGSIINVSITISPVRDSAGIIIGASKISRDITASLKAEQALKRSESKFKSVFDSGMVGIMFWKLDGEIFETNEEFLEIVGYTRQDFEAGKLRWSEMTPAEYATLDEDALEQMKLTGSCKPFEKEYYRKDGSRVHVLIGAALIDDRDTLTGVAFVIDITQRKLAEMEVLKLNDELLRSERKFRSLIENSYDIVTINDAEFNSVYRSPAVEKITGWSPEENQSIAVAGRLHPDDLESIQLVARQVINNPGIPFPVRLRTKHKDGHYVYLEGIMTNMLQNDSINGIVSNFRDVTETMKAQEKLRESERIYRTIASNIPGSAIVLIDKDYRYILIEGDLLEKLGYLRENLLGKTLQEALPQERYEEVRPWIQRVFRGETFTSSDARSGYYIVSKYVPLKDEHDSVYAAMIVLNDVTELKKAERLVNELNMVLEQQVSERTEQLKAANKELEAFSYSVSHDLRAPLRIINGFGQILMEDYAEQVDEEGKNLIQIIMNNAKRMGKLIDELLAFSKLGKSEMNISQVNMNEVIEEVLRELAAGGINIPAMFSVHKLEPAWGDTNLIKQVWINLISNAIKYSGAKENPAIEIGMLKKDGEDVYYIKDNGAGFDMRYADKLFGVFQRLHRQEEFAGIGVGLALVQRIITRHEGRIWAEAEPGKGATFYFTFPNKKPVNNIKKEKKYEYR